MEYPVYLGEEKVGTARVDKEGLYYRIKCVCHQTDSVPFRITARAEHSIDLGLCIPDGDSSGLQVRIPAKRLGEGNPKFFIGTRHDELPEKWVPVSSEEPFADIAKLKNAYMVLHNGKTGIAFRYSDQFPDQPDNDPNP